MKPRTPRRTPLRDIAPPEVPEVSAAPAKPPAGDADDPIPEHIRKMLVAAYT